MDDRSADIISLCMVIDTGVNTPDLLRLADMKNDQLKYPDVIDGVPHLFENRDRLFRRDGPNTVGDIGVWKWSAVPNFSDPKKDYVISSYIPIYKPIELYRITGIDTRDELIKRLSEGFDFPFQSHDIAFLIPSASEVSEAILCSIGTFETTTVGVRLKSDVYTLPVFSVSNDDVLTFYPYADRKSRKFYRYFTIGNPAGYATIKKPIDAVRNAILKRTTWKSFQSLVGGTRRELHSFKDFLNTVTDESLYLEVAHACGCTEELAMQYVTEFLQNANAYLDGTELDTSVLAALVERHDGLRRRCEVIGEERWKTIHQAEMEKAANELQAVTQDTKQKETLYQQLIRDIATAQEKLSNLQTQVAYYEELGENSLEAVQNKLSSARKDVAGFMAELAIYMPQGNPTELSGEELPLYHVGTELPKECAGESFSWKDTVVAIEDELIEAGISNARLHTLAAFLYAAYVNKNSMILAGPAAESIAHALSCAITGRFAGVLECSGEWAPSAVSTALHGSGDIVAIKNPFNGKWIDRLIVEIEKAEKMVILVHPFAEDLSVEPKGLYNYVTPLITEEFVDKRPTKQFIGSYRTEDYTEYEAVKPRSQYGRVLKKMCISSLAMSRTQQLLTDAHAMLGDKENDNTTDMDFLYGLFPFAVATGESEAFCELVRASSGLSKDIQNYFLQYFHFEDE